MKKLISLFVIKSWVNGVSIELDCETLGKILDVPLEELRAYITSDSDLALWEQDCPKFFKTICVRRSTDGGVVNHELKKDIQLFHKFLNVNVTPKKGHFEAVSPMQCFILYCYKTQKPLDLNYIILKEMANAAFSKYKSLPFGSILTKVFKHFKVPFTEVGEYISKPFDSFTTTRSGFGKVETDKEDKTDEEEEVGDEIDPMDEGTGNEQEQQPATEMNPSQAPQWNKEPSPYWADFVGKFEQMSVQQNNLVNHVTQLTESSSKNYDFMNKNYEDLNKRVDNLYTLYQSQFPPPPPSFDDATGGEN